MSSARGTGGVEGMSLQINVAQAVALTDEETEAREVRAGGGSGSLPLDALCLHQA